MMAMYVGFRLLGFLGLIAGPVLLNLLRVVLEADKVSRKTPPEINEGIKTSAAPKKQVKKETKAE